MRKQTFIMLFLFDIVVLWSIAYVIITSLGIDLRLIFIDWQLTLRFMFTLMSLSVTVLMLLLVGWFLLDVYGRKQLNEALHRISENRSINYSNETEVGQRLNVLSKKMRQVTESLQKTENAYIENSEDIVKQERRRIARDLHDTVSQELFASSMILSGLVNSVPELSVKQIQEQLQLLEGIVNNAQNDLRILLLHLRPVELENKTLSQGLSMILKELTDKATIEVVFRENLKTLPKVIEENLFRIAQEFISNTLKHAKATRLEVYLHQSDTEIQLKLVDDGIGFDIDETRELRYGLKNIEERVEDMAGTIKMLSQKNKGVSMTIRIPLVEGSGTDYDN